MLFHTNFVFQDVCFSILTTARSDALSRLWLTRGWSHLLPYRRHCRYFYYQTFLCSSSSFSSSFSSFSRHAALRCPSCATEAPSVYAVATHQYLPYVFHIHCFHVPRVACLRERFFESSFYARLGLALRAVPSSKT